MLLGLTELSNSSAPITSTPNKLKNGMTSLLTNGNHSTDGDDVKAVDSSPDHQLHDSSVIESKPGSTSDFNTNDENELETTEGRGAGGDGEAIPSPRVPSPRTDQVLGGMCVEESGCSEERMSQVTGYTRCQNVTPIGEVEGLKQRLLSTLANMIPHEESLSLRLLINYTIDGADSECLIIDETLRRQQGARNRERVGGTERVVSGGVRKGESDAGPEYLEVKRRRRVHQLLYKEAPVLDLSRQDECSGATPAGDRRDGRRMEGGVATGRQELPNDSLRTSTLGILNGSSVCDKSVSVSTEGGSVAAGIPPLIDPSVIALLPFLQHQLQQQQDKQREAQQQQQNVSQMDYFGLTGQTENMHGNCQPIQSYLTPEGLLMKQLQALVENSNTVATGSVNDGAKKGSPDGCINKRMESSNLGAVHSSIDNITATLLNGSGGTVTCGGLGSSVGNTTTNSMIDLPFLGALNTEQLSALLPPPSFISQSKSGTTSTNVINSILGGNVTNRPTLLNRMQQQPLPIREQEQEENRRIPTGGFTSVNLGSATLLNLRDKMTGLETLGILPVTGSRTLTQPMANLFNHIGQTTSGISSAPVSTSVSLQKLSSFSNFFNSLASTNLVQTPSSSPPASTSATTVPMASTSLNPTNMAVASNPFSLSLPLSLPLPLSRTSMLPTSLNTSMSVDSTTVTPTTLFTMLPNITATTDVVDMLTSLNNVGSQEKNHLVTLETLTAAVDRMKNQLPSTIENSDVRKMGSDTGMIPMAKSLDSSGLVNSPGSAGESHDSSPSSANNLMFGRRLVNNRRFICNQCRKNYSSLAELNRHTLEAHNSFKCTICSAHFTQRSNLQRHSLKHVGFKPFTCNLCKKEYYRKDHLVRHIEVTHPSHDPKMNITVHLTSSECLEYLDRINTGKETPSPGDPENQTAGDIEMTEEEYLKIDEGNPEESGEFHTESLKVQQFQPAVSSEAHSPAE